MFQTEFFNPYIWGWYGKKEPWHIKEKNLEYNISNQ